MIDFIKAGGPLAMIMVILLGITAFILFILSLYYLGSKNEINRNRMVKINEMILFFGSISFLCGIFFQFIGFYQAFNAIKEAADVAPHMILEGFLVSCFAPLTGLSFLFFSVIFWFIIRNQIKKIT